MRGAGEGSGEKGEGDGRKGEGEGEKREGESGGRGEKRGREKGERHPVIMRDFVSFIYFVCLLLSLSSVYQSSLSRWSVMQSMPDATLKYQSY